MPDVIRSSGKSPRNLRKCSCRWLRKRIFVRMHFPFFNKSLYTGRLRNDWAFTEPEEKPLYAMDVEVVLLTYPAIQVQWAQMMSPSSLATSQASWALSGKRWLGFTFAFRSTFLALPVPNGIHRTARTRQKSNAEAGISSVSQSIHCWCHGGEHGKMVACDNPQCAIEWLHLNCVALTRKPRG